MIQTMQVCALQSLAAHWWQGKQTKQQRVGQQYTSFHALTWKERQGKAKERKESAVLKENFWTPFRRSLKIGHPNGVAAESQ